MQKQITGSSFGSQMLLQHNRGKRAAKTVLGAMEPDPSCSHRLCRSNGTRPEL